MDRLEDTATGTFQVTSETSVYLVDLDRRRLMRIPGAGEGPRVTDEGVQVILATLPGDHSWVPLFELLQCQLGQPMIALAEPRPDGSMVWRQTTLVQDIRPIVSPPDAAPPDPWTTAMAETPSLRKLRLRGTGEDAEKTGAAFDIFFDRDGNPIDLDTVLQHFADPEYRFLARTQVRELEVVTAWLGTNQDFDRQPPLIFGTVALRTGDPEAAMESREYFAATQEEAMANHTWLVAALENPPHAPP